ncbi:hypothetical protein [Solicola sp. PLA-1-18]|uniref:hypothetical protein n=1 Tax=Solicola sp. PLA-1-18 TaxID=3380532 RepID=UPI003B7D09CD
MKSGNTALVLKVLVAVAALVIAGTLAADVFGRFLDRPAQSTLAGAGALVAFLSASAAAVGKWRSQRAESHREAAGVRLRALGWSVYDLTGIDVRDLGLAMYVVRPSPVRRWRTLLRRVAYERSRRAVTTGVQWRPGMGVIGQCVASGERAGQDVGIDEEPYLDLVVRTRSEYESQVPEHVRSGSRARSGSQLRPAVVRGRRERARGGGP